MTKRGGRKGGGCGWWVDTPIYTMSGTDSHYIWKVKT